FDELLDIAPFFNATGSTAPILYTGRRTFVNTSGNRECSPNSTAQPLGGAPSVTLDSTRGVTTVTYQPPSLLPGNSGVEVNIPYRLRDMAGVPAAPQLFQFITEGAQLTEHDVTEEFVTDANLDRDASSGTWANGLATFGQIGGDGSLGPF